MPRALSTETEAGKCTAPTSLVGSHERDKQLGGFSSHVVPSCATGEATEQPGREMQGEEQPRVTQRQRSQGCRTAHHTSETNL